MYQAIDYKNIVQQAQGQWHYILPALGVPAEALTNKHKSCPACGGNDRFRFDDKQGRGTFICTHWNNGSGDGFALIQHLYGCDFKEAARLAAGVLGITEANPLPERKTPPQPPQQPQQDAISRLTALWDGATPATSTEAITSYLAARGLDADKIQPALGNLRFCESLAYWSDGQHLGNAPAMLGKFSSLDGTLMGLHRTYLNQQRDGKLQATDPHTGTALDAKKWTTRYSGSTRGTAIQLMAATDTLAVCEGIENALAVYEQTALPVWACGAAHGLGGLVLPDTLRQLFIFADNDANQAGIKAAHKLESRAASMGIEVRIWQSETVGVDVLDLVAARKAAA